MSKPQALPPFPSDVPTAGLVSVSLRDLEDELNTSSSRAKRESARMFTASCQLGFFYLNLQHSDTGRAILEEVSQLHELQQHFFALPHEVKDEYGQDKVDPFFSYRWTGCENGVKDMYGRPGRREMYNLRADDFSNVRSPLSKPDLIRAAEPLLTSFASHSRQVAETILLGLEKRLQLPPGTLMSLHRRNLPSGDFVSLQHRASEPYDEILVRKGEHTDFGSVTMLFNWLGGLQIRDQAQGDGKEGEWVYVKPIPGSCVINLADSLVRLTAGILKSNIHRVAPAPGLQAGLPRYSLVYFAHPNDDVKLVPVKGGLVDAVTGKEDDGIVATAAEWVDRRSLGDLRGIYTYKGGVELRENNDAVSIPIAVAE